MTESLASVQRVLADLLRSPTPLVDDPGLAARATPIATGNERLSAVEQIDIYREQFFLRHVDVLREDFRSLEHLLGDAGFDTLAKGYLAAHPPSSFSLRDLGHAMARFVSDTDPWSADPFVADLARVEWAFVEAFDAPELPPLDVGTFATASEDAWPRARLTLQPAVQRLALGYPAHDYRVAARKGEAPARPEPASTCVVVYRGPEVLHYMDIEPDAFALLDELARGRPLGSACEHVARSSGAEPATFEARLGGWFSDWTRLGWIARVDFDAPTA